MSESWKIDPAKGDYMLDELGRPVIDVSLATPGYIRLKTHRTKWLYAPDKKYGSDFYLGKIKRDLNNTGASISIAKKALQPMLDNKSAVSVKVVSTGNTRYALEFSATIVDNKGKSEEIILNPVGI